MALILLIVMLIGWVGGAAVPQVMPLEPQSARPSRLFKDSRYLLAIARSQGEREVTLLVAAAPGGAAEIVRRVASLGGLVRYRDDGVGYLRVRLPIEHVISLSEFDRVESVVVDNDSNFPGNLEFTTYDRMQTKPRTAAVRPEPPVRTTTTEGEAWPPVWSDYPLRHPYSPLGDIDAEQFVRQHPTFDGRGVTIAVLDMFVDNLLPEFQTAYTLDGKRVPKLADSLNVTDPRDDAAQVPQWVNMREQAGARDRRITFQGKMFYTPRDGSFRIGFFNERREGIPDQDIDRDGNPKGVDGLFGVLWDELTNEVWVDTNRNLSFVDEKAMTDYIKRQDVGVFGKDNVTTAVRESISYTVQTDSANRFVSINTGIGWHSTLIMGSVVGNRESKGRLQGIAPGARILPMRIWVNGSEHAKIEGLIAAFKNPLVDLIVQEGNVGRGYKMADARHLGSIIAQRLIERYDKLLFVPGGNFPGFGIVEFQDGLAPAAVSVGAYQSQESYRINWGVIPEGIDHMHWVGRSHGPSGNGAMKPDLLAPSGSMSTDVGYWYIKNENELRGLFQLPPGYALGEGTSTAAPMAAGAAALVVSAAKQTGVQFDAPGLKAALIGSARYIPDLKAHEQGNGLIQVNAAYELLKKIQQAPGVTIVSRAPVRTRLNNLLQTPNEGTGLYEREGWSVGDKGTRTISFTRTTGPAEPMTFTLSWQGNDGTFSSPSSLVLPLNKSVELPVSIAIKDVGAHSAILTLDNPLVPGHSYRVLNTVVAPFQFTPENNYTVTTEISVPLPDDRSVFVQVPPGTALLRFSAVSSDAKVSLHPISPSRTAANWTINSSGVVAHPEPGVWEINNLFEVPYEFDPGRPQPLKPAKVKVTVALAGTQIEADGMSAERIKSRTSIDVSVKLANHFGPVSTAVTGGSLGSAFRTKRTIEQGQQHVYEIVIPKGISLLYARVSDVAETRADLDVYLFDCTSSETKCEARAKADTVDPDGEVRVLNPAPGKWKVVVDAYSMPGGQTSYDYNDIYTHPKFGSIFTTDSHERRETGAAWRTTAHIWVASAADNQRSLAARLTATSPDIKDYNGNLVPFGSLDIPLGPNYRNANGNMIFEGDHVKGRDGAPSLKPEDYAKFDLFQPSPARQQTVATSQNTPK